MNYDLTPENLREENRLVLSSSSSMFPGAHAQFLIEHTNESFRGLTRPRINNYRGRRIERIGRARLVSIVKGGQK